MGLGLFIVIHVAIRGDAESPDTPKYPVWGGYSCHLVWLSPIALAFLISFESRSSRGTWIVYSYLCGNKR